MATLLQAATITFTSYYFYETFLSLLLAFKMATDQRFNQRKRYTYAAAILLLPFVDYFYISYLGYSNREVLEKYWNIIKSQVGRIW